MTRRLVLALLVGSVLAVDVGTQRGYVSPPSSYTQNDTYIRSQWRHWTDEDRDCLDSRQEVLVAESVIPVTFDKTGCRVLAGEWHDPYTGRTVTDPRQLQIDHVVALGWAHYHGGWMWDAQRKRDFANDLTHPEHLIAVWGPANQAKGRLGPDDWTPENSAHWCAYGTAWQQITDRWGLMLTWREHAAVQALLNTCLKE